MHALHRDEPDGRRAARRGNALALVFVGFTIAALVVVIGGTLLARTDDPAAAALAERRPASVAAGAAASDTVQRIDATGVIDFRSDVIDDWSNRWGSTWRSAPRATARDARTPPPERGASDVDPVRQAELRPVAWYPLGFERRDRRVCTARHLASSGF